MKKIFNKLLCNLGFHKKHTKTVESEVNWVFMSVKITECKHCKKFYNIK